MREESYQILFETEEGMAKLAQHPCVWRSVLYFMSSIGLFTGVVTNTWLLKQPLTIRAGAVLSVILFFVMLTFLYAMLLHGILETFGALAGSARALLCILGYTVLPFMVLTPVALCAGRSGWGGLPLLGVVFFWGLVWTIYLLIRALEVVYVINFWQSVTVVVFSLVLLFVFLAWPFKVGISLVRVVIEGI